MGYGALTDEQTSSAMERNKLLKNSLSKTYRLGETTKAKISVKKKLPKHGQVAKCPKKKLENRTQALD